VLLLNYGGDHYSRMKVTMEEPLNGIVNEINNVKNRGILFWAGLIMDMRNLKNQMHITCGRNGSHEIVTTILLCFGIYRGGFSANERGFTCTNDAGRRTWLH